MYIAYFLHSCTCRNWIDAFPASYGSTDAHIKMYLLATMYLFVTATRALYFFRLFGATNKASLLAYLSSIFAQSDSKVKLQLSSCQSLLYVYTPLAPLRLVSKALV